MQKKVGIKKGKRVAVIAFVIASVLLINLASASDVAYIYKKGYKVDQNILNVFKELGLTYELINEENIPSSFSGYNLIFVGDENFRNPGKLPIEEIPTIVANYYHGPDFGLTDLDGISKLGSSDPLEVKKGGEIIQVYTKARYSIGSEAIPYYFLDDENKAPGMQRVASTWVGTPKTGTSSQFGDVISYANPGIKLMNGKTTREKICFFGIIESDYWTPAAREMFKECVGFVSTSCNKDSDCGEGETGEKYCEGKNIYRDATAYECINPGKADSDCRGKTEKELVEECSHGCKDGECVEECSINSDCGTDYFSDKYCKSDDVYRGVFNYSCLLGECSRKNSTEKFEECGEDSCSSWQFYCIGKEAWKNQTCYDKGCSNGECFSGASVKKEFIGECDYGCSDGECTEETEECSTDGDCDDGVFCNGQEKCTGGECVSGTGIDCSQYNIAEIASCNNTPDGNPLTWDYRQGFLSYCDENEDSCAIEYFNLTSSCSAQCGAQCTNNSDCPEKCTSTHKLYTVSKCENCECKYSGYKCIIGKCGAECSNNSDCQCQQDYCNGTVLVDYPVQGICGTAGSSACLCNCTSQLIPGAPECRENEGNCSKDEDCPADYYGENYCMNNDSYEELHNYSCVLGECGEKIVRSFTDCGESEIGDWNYVCEEMSVYRNREKIERGCELGECFSETSGENEFVEECEKSCISGKCEGIKCYKDSDCGTDWWAGEDQCVCTTNVWDFWKEHTCNNPGTTSSECTSKETFKLKKECGNDSCSSWQFYCIGKEAWKNQTCYDKGCLSGECFSKESVKEELVETCAYGCSDGECVGECSEDSGCPADYYGENYCMNSDAYKELHEHSCVLGECGEKIVRSFTDCGESFCGEWQNYCKCGEIWRKRSCYTKGCEAGECYLNASEETELVKKCIFECLDWLYKDSGCSIEYFS